MAQRPRAVGAITSKHRETIIATIQDLRATRGTKRMCQACETKFYDLARERIVCPSCGEEYTATARPVIDVATYVSAPSGKTGWRRKVVKPSKPAFPTSDKEDALPETSSDAAEEAPETGPDDDLVLEQEPDDGDVSGLVEHVEEPKEP